MTTTVFEHSETVTPNNVDYQDGKRAMIVQVGGDNNVDQNFFMRLQSWDDANQHDFLKSLLGKQVKNTIEIID